MVAYLFDETLKRELNRSGKNCWDAYLREIDNQLGVCGRMLSPAQAGDADQLRRVRVLVIGSQTGERLTAKARENVARWVEEGGILIGFAVDGLDDLFGIRTVSTLPQPVDDYAISAYFEFRLHELTREIHPFLLTEQKLFALSDVRLVDRVDGIELAHLHDAEERDLKRPAITWRKCGSGYAGYFAFDVAKTVWLLHQGRPLPEIPEGQYALRTPQMQVLGRNSTKVAYADEMVLLIQNMMAQAGGPFIYQIPPDDGRVPDALLCYSGDEYRGPVELSLKASDFMASKGLPYHINIDAEHHPMTAEEFQHIRDNGHEVSCYVWIRTQDGGSALNEQRMKDHSDALHRRFGVRPGSVLIGSTQWRGGAEPARWLAQAGATADNSFVGSKLYDNPLLNGPFFGFGFGTGYPFFFYDDAEHENERIDLIEQPIVCYELGHRASLVDEHTKERESETRAPEEVHEPVDRAVRYHLVMNVFYHPWYIANCPYCRDAIEELLRYADRKGARVLHMGNNRVADWWRARARARIVDLEISENAVRFTGACDWPSGMIVKLRLRKPVSTATCDGQPVPHEVKTEFGGDWAYIVLPAGEHRVGVNLQPA